MSRRARGAATAELVVALPVLMAVTIALAWFVSLGVAQARVVDAARETARAVARGDDMADALRRGREVGPPGTRLSVSRGAGSGAIPGSASGTAASITVTARAVIRGPGGLFNLVPVTVRASATAVDEIG